MVFINTKIIVPIISLSIGAYISIITFSGSLIKREIGDPGIYFVPFIVSIILIIVSITMLGQSIITRQKSNESIKIPKEMLIILFFLGLSFILYYTYLKEVGFIVITAIFMPILMVFFKRKIAFKDILFTSIIILLLYAIFKLGLKVPLPRGYIF